MPGVVWIRSYFSDAEGKIYCEYDAPDRDAVVEHARRAGLPADRISEVALEISPAMFRWRPGRTRTRASQRALNPASHCSASSAAAR
jgi:hypothetical protein